MQIQKFGPVGLALLAFASCSATEDSEVRGAPSALSQADFASQAGAQVAQRILSAALTRGQAYANLRRLTRVAPRRLSGSEGAARAVAWAEGAMRSAGLENVRLEPCTVPHWVRGEVERLVITAPAELEGQELPILALGGSVATPPGGLEAGVVVVRDFAELEAEGFDARGKFVLFNRPMDDASLSTFDAYGSAVEQRTQGAARAAQVGAVGSITRALTTLRNDVPHTGAMGYWPGVPKVPAVAVSTNGADRIEQLLREGVELRLRLELACETLPDAASFNVVGELVGRELPDEIVLVGAHLDAWDVGQGAHDDGAGCVQALEALRLLKVLDLRPRRTLRVVLFMNEENGLGGGRAYYAAHVGEMAKHVLAIESDSGGFTPRGFTSDAQPGALAALQGIAAWLAGSGADSVRTGEGGADISPMAQSGVPLVGYEPDSQRYFDLHHSELDVFEAVNERELSLGAAAIAVLAWGVAEREKLLPRH
jgi:hypothetical protein